MCMFSRKGIQTICFNYFSYLQPLAVQTLIIVGAVQVYVSVRACTNTLLYNIYQCLFIFWLNFRNNVFVLLYSQTCMMPRKCILHRTSLAGLSKIGVELVFINFNLRGKSLLHGINVSGAKALIVGHSKGKSRQPFAKTRLPKPISLLLQEW